MAKTSYALCSFITILWPVFVSAQSLQKIVTGFELCNLRGVVALKGGHVILGGFCYHSDSLKNQVVLVKVDKDGVVLSKLVWGNYKNENVQSIQIDDEKKLVVCAGEASMGTRRKGFILAFDTNLTILWEKQIGSDDYDITFKHVEVHNEVIVCAGTRTMLINPFPNSSFYIYVTNVHGDSLRADAGTAYNFEIANVVTRTGDPGRPFVIAGDAVGTGKVDPFHAFINDQYRLSDAYIWPQEGFGAGFQAATISTDGYLYFGGEGYPPGSYTFDFLIGKLDTSNQQIWQKWIHQPGTNAIFDLQYLDNNLLGFTGYSNGNDTTAAIDAVIGIVDSSGTLLRLDYIPNPGIDVGYRIIYHRNEIILAGTFAQGMMNMFGVYRTDAADYLQAKDRMLPKADIMIWPNPVEKYLHINTPLHGSIQLVSIWDQTGKMCFQKIYPEPINRDTIDISDIHCPGLKAIVVKTNTGIFCKKFIFEP